MAQSESEWPTGPTGYELLSKIGHGAFATVWRGRRVDAPMECAIKVLNLDNVDSNLTEIRREVQAMRLSSHPNVLACHTAFVQDMDLWLVTQLMRKGSSLHCLQTARSALRRKNPSSPPSMEEHILYIVHETLLGLEYIHNNGQIHRDVKAGNILLDGNGEVRIADFGVSGWLLQAGTEQAKAKTFVGTPCWMSPEVMEQIHGYDYKADIWSLGITALELAKGYAPYAKYPPMKVLILTIQEDPPSLDTYDEEGDDATDAVDDEEWSKTFRSLVDTCLQKNPTKRPNCQELLQSKALVALNDEEHRQARREAIRTQVCDLVEDVGTTGDEAQKSQMPGNVPVSIFRCTEENRPAGTTWVFQDGSQVLASSQQNASVDDVMDTVEQFGLQTGGEHYDRSKQAQDEPDDDLEQFMDEFEQFTSGENFRRQSNDQSRRV